MATSSASSVCILSLALLLLCSPSHAFLVPVSSPHLSYHHGPLLAGPQPINLYLTFYGKFGPSDQATLRAFLSSLSGIKEDRHPQRRSMRSTPYNIIETPSVGDWWAVTRHYTDVEGRSVSQKLEVCGETKDDTYSLGRHLKAEDIALLAKTTAEALSVAAPNSVILVFTAQDVYVEGFCMHSCGGHSDMHMESPSPSGGGSKVPYGWVGNSGEQCPGLCAWPFARPQYGPPMDPLKAPNGRDVDGMVINLAKLLVSIATNPLGNAYYQGGGGGGGGGDNVSNNFGLEVGGACFGQFGTGSYPGYPGLLISNPITGASYNVEGIGGAQFLVPWIWNPSTLSCVGQA